MADRLRSIREKLYNVIANKLKTPGSWHHIKRSTGMFWYVSLREDRNRPDKPLARPSSLPLRLKPYHHNGISTSCPKAASRSAV
jgi:hypothetical protein